MDDVKILDVLGERGDTRTMKKDVRRARQSLREELAACQAYEGGLAREVMSEEKRKAGALARSRLAVRRAWLSRQGRPIDLVALLRQTRKDGTPVWSIVDPTKTGNQEGKFDTDGTILIGGSWKRFFKDGDPQRPRKAFVPVGIPPLPRQARRLLTDKKIRERARWVGLLFQPEEWLEVQPDPAVVVEWKDLPDQYFALAVWGHDGPAVMEFVD